MKSIHENLEDLSDDNLIIEYQNGNNKAFPFLVERWHVKFCKLAYWYVKDADISKDIAQECWTIIFDKLKTLKEPNKFKSWATSIVNRKSIDWLRANTRREKNKHTYQMDKKNAYHEINDADDKSIIHEFLKGEIEKLSDKQQVIIRLFYLEEYSLKQIATLLNITIGTAKSRLFYTREKLKKKFKNNNYER